MKKIFILLLLLFLCGLVSGDILTTGIKESSGLLGIEVYKEYANAKLNFEMVFWQVFFERCKGLLFVILLLLTPLRERLPLLLLSVLAFSMGFFVMSNIISLGVVGIFVALVVFVPVIVFYGGMILVLYRKQTARHYHNTENRIGLVVIYLLVSLLFVTGCIVESVMGIHLIPWMIRLSLI